MTTAAAKTARFTCSPLVPDAYTKPFSAKPLASSVIVDARDYQVCKATTGEAAKLIVEAVNAYEAQERLTETLTGALCKAEQFIANGVELGFIRMPDTDTPDTAHDTLPAIRTALSQAKRIE